jgi:hypothetical protein
MKIVSGPPLLCQAALDALKKWKYEPTYLNDRPIAVRMTSGAGKPGYRNC